MNEKLLLRHKINFPTQYIEFLNFIHPNFEIVNDLLHYDNLNPIGIIYVGQYDDDTLGLIEQITRNWIIVNAHNYDLDLTTNEGLIKNLLPIHYIRLKADLKKSDFSVYNKINYNVLLEKIKVCLIDNSQLELQQDIDNSVYNLFIAILGTPDTLNYSFFTIVNANNVMAITSSLLTFLIKVQTLNTYNASVSYARLITQSNKRYGRHIQHGISLFVKSKANPEVSLYNLLTFLNKAR